MQRTARALLPLAFSTALIAPLALAQGASAAPAEQHAAGQQTVRAQSGAEAAAAYSRTTTINRAKKWLTANNGHQVPYSQTKTWGGYRTDCSGYVSMALSLGKPGPNTVGLATSTYTKKIKMASLKKGDLIIDKTGGSTARHVVIFVKWSSSAHKSYKAYEQRGGHGTDYRTLSYGVGSDQYDAYRPKKYG
ncbi:MULTISPECIES: NlpC/P60 family protein [Streptomyces]|uniref:Membrane protein n=1 Tax=Streptomyces albus (strain ATCC 21838 / DSM 41398 / FERM P-419 / JCM 4703 / NBRC 107858) TaxID=1081613 RepID=A0A0B5EWD5_STRA4|nr:NlpC/P60 family protein [Streptomyces sp. SCSIO ZS0520]AJE82996.1 membrane protein [Streptomyces albus]AOU77307.1 membrane protein [Streptomyces albus]AYN33083.1 peptidoglycan endopeptidase [Streptomyces albus]